MSSVVTITPVVLYAPLFQIWSPFLATYIVAVPSLYIEPNKLASFIDFHIDEFWHSRWFLAATTGTG